MKLYIKVIIGSILLIALGILYHPIYDNEDIKSYVGVCKDIDSRKGISPSSGKTYIVMNDGSEFQLLTDQISIKRGVFSKAMENSAIFKIGYAYDFLGKPIVVTLDIENYVHFTLEQWNSASKKNIIILSIFILLVDIGIAFVFIPPKYKRIENRNRKAKEKAKKAKLKEKAKAKKANS